MSPRIAALLAATAVSAAAPFAFGQRALGVDVSDWQGAGINWNTAAKPIAQGGGGISFAFIRSSRGGTTGDYDEVAKTGTLSQKYDDLYVNQNMAGAKAAGVLAGNYHFARPDIATNTGIDEANHFFAKAGQWMRPGYLRPVLDLEAGDAARTTTQLTDFAMDFSNRLLALTGVRPIVYINSYYANTQVDARINVNDLWLARWVDPAVVNIQTVQDPPAASGYPNQYGVWNPTYPTVPAQRPWDFWQYKSTGPVAGVGNPVDQDIANGDIEFVKDFLVPALWFVNSDGQWTTASNWNGVTVLPQPIDRVIVDRTGGTYTINLGSGTHSIRSLQMNENFTQSGGSLTVAQYANFTGNSTISGGSLTSATMANSALFTISGGTVTTGNVTGLGHLSIDGGTFKATKIGQGSISILNGTLQLTGTATSRVSGFGITGAGKLDLGAAKFIAQAGPLADIVGYLAAGKIMTSSGGPGAGVAYFLASDLFTSFPATFGDEPVLMSSYTLLARALRGDTDLSGTVDFNDLVSIAQSYGAAGRWRNGDFNYDSTVDFNDLVSLAQNYGNTLLDNGTLVAGDGSNFASDWALAQSLAPEPSIALLMLPALARRRRSR